MKHTYSESFIEQALVKVYSRGSRTIQSVAEELNINQYTVKHWMRNKEKALRNLTQPTAPEKRPQDWRAEEQLLALQESHVLTGDDLNAWCRERGLFAHHLSSWKSAFCNPQKASTAGLSDPREVRGLKDENEQLKRELLRKEKALAEAAALLILQKKFRALWEGEAK
jgi:transposase-like protein